MQRLDDVVRRVYRAVCQHLPCCRAAHDVAAAVDRLLASPPGRRHLLAQRADTRCPHVAEELLDRAWTARWDAPAHASAILDSADLVIGHLEGRIRPALHADLRARSLSYRANSARISGDLSGSARLLAVAGAALLEGTGDPLLLAEHVRLRASLLAGRRRWSAAADLLHRAHSLAVESGDAPEAAKILIKIGLYQAYSLDHQAAIRTLRRAAHDVDGVEHPEDLLHAIHSLAVALDGAGHPSTALSLLEGSARLASGIGRGVMHLRVQWLQARIRHQLGQHQLAAESYSQLTGAYQDAGRPYEAGLCQLELAVCEASLHHWPQAEAAAAAALHVLTGLDIPREATAALHVLRQAVQAQALDLAILRSAAHHLDPTPRRKTAR